MCCFTLKVYTLRYLEGDGRTDARTDGRKIFTQYSGISSCSQGSMDMDMSATYILLPKSQSFSTKGCVYLTSPVIFDPDATLGDIFLPNLLRCIWLPNQLECI
jgi:hypothetical protein